MSVSLFLNLSNSYSSMNMTHINYLVSYMNGKVYIVFNRSYFPKMTDFSRLGPLLALMYTVKVVASKKWCKIDTSILQTTNRKYHVAYRFVPFPVTLDDPAGHSPVAGVFKCNLTNICATFCTVLADTARRVVHRR